VVIVVSIWVLFVDGAILKGVQGEMVRGGATGVNPSIEGMAEAAHSCHHPSDQCD
jgi:hypothetical protein